MKKLLSLLLLSALILSFAACGSETVKRPEQKTSGTTAPVSDTDPDDANYEPLSLPELNYGGEKVSIVTNYNDETDTEFLVEDLKNEPVNDAIYNRELFVEDLLSVELERRCPEMGISSYIDKMYVSGDIPGDVICAPSADNAWRTPNGYYRDLFTLNNISPSSPWWSQNYNDEISICDMLFLTCGDLSLSMLRNVYVVFFNKNLAEQNGIDNVYDLVFDGDWTIDVATEISSGIYRDINGNSECDEEDIYGFIVASMISDPCWSAFDIDIFSKDEDNLLTYTPNLDKFGLAHDKLCKLFDQKSTFINGFSTDTGPTMPTYAMFANGTAMLAIAKLGVAETTVLRNMQDDYSILPMMKFDKEQKEYYTMPHDDYVAFGISSMLDDATAERAAAVLEAMAWYSYRYVKPAYLDIAMKGKYANDQQTRQMIDMVMAGMRIDAAWMYAYPLLDYPQKWRYLLDDRTMNYASTFASMERNLKIRLKELNDSFMALANE